MDELKYRKSHQYTLTLKEQSSQRLLPKLENQLSEDRGDSRSSDSPTSNSGRFHPDDDNKSLQNSSLKQKMKIDPEQSSHSSNAKGDSQGESGEPSIREGKQRPSLAKGERATLGKRSNKSRGRTNNMPAPTTAVQAEPAIAAMNNIDKSQKEADSHSEGQAVVLPKPTRRGKRQPDTATGHDNSASTQRQISMDLSAGGALLTGRQKSTGTPVARKRDLKKQSSFKQDSVA